MNFTGFFINYEVSTPLWYILVMLHRHTALQICLISQNGRRIRQHIPVVFTAHKCYLPLEPLKIAFFFVEEGGLTKEAGAKTLIGFYNQQKIIIF